MGDGRVEGTSLALERLPGTYRLLLLSTTTTPIRIGHRGELQLQPGYYVYVGSALGSGGLRGRVAHHILPVERPHWHIDCLKTHVTLERIWSCYGLKRREHLWAKRIDALRGAAVPLAGSALPTATASHICSSSNSRPG